MNEKLGFKDGFRLAFSNISYVKKNKKLFVLGIVPTLVALIVTIFFISLTWKIAQRFEKNLLESLEGLPFADLIATLAWGVGLALGLILTFYLIKLVLSLLTSPFNLGITKEVFATIDGDSVSLKDGFLYGIKKIIPCVAKEIIYELMHGTLLVFTGILLTLLHALPVAGALLWGFANIYVALVSLGIEYLLYPFGIKEKNIVDGILKTFQAGYQHHTFFAGLGLAYFIILFIPFLNTLLIPVMIVSSVKAYKKITE